MSPHSSHELADESQLHGREQKPALPLWSQTKLLLQSASLWHGESKVPLHMNCSSLLASFAQLAQASLPTR